MYSNYFYSLVYKLKQTRFTAVRRLLLVIFLLFCGYANTVKFIQILKYNNIKNAFIRGGKSIFGWSDDTSTVHDLIYNELLNRQISAIQHWCSDRVQRIYKKTLLYFIW